jgi:hypothetical protein
VTLGEGIGVTSNWEVNAMKDRRQPSHATPKDGQIRMGFIAPITSIDPIHYIFLSTKPKYRMEK